MSIRNLFGILIALAVLLAPSAVFAEQMATMSDHDMPMMPMDHCEGPPTKSADHDKNAGMNCCIAMCMAVAIAPHTPLTFADEPSPAMTYPPLRVSWHGRLAEIATPPPRNA